MKAYQAFILSRAGARGTEIHRVLGDRENFATILYFGSTAAKLFLMSEVGCLDLHLLGGCVKKGFGKIVRAIRKVAEGQV